MLLFKRQRLPRRLSTNRINLKFWETFKKDYCQSSIASTQTTAQRVDDRKGLENHQRRFAIIQNDAGNLLLIAPYWLYFYNGLFILQRNACFSLFIHDVHSSGYFKQISQFAKRTASSCFGNGGS